MTALPLGALRPAAQTGSWREKNKAPSQGGRRSRGAPGAGEAEAEVPRARQRCPPASSAASPAPRAPRRTPHHTLPPPLAPPGPPGSGSPEGTGSGLRRKWGERREAGAGGGGQRRGGGGGRGGGRVRPRAAESGRVPTAILPQFPCVMAPVS